MLPFARNEFFKNFKNNNYNLITDRRLRIWLRISIFRNGGSNMADIKFWNLYDFRTTLNSGFFGVADYKF